MTRRGDIILARFPYTYQTGAKLRPASPAFGATGLKTTSVFRIGKIASLSDALIMGKLGELAEPVFDDVVGRLVRLLRPV